MLFSKSAYTFELHDDGTFEISTPSGNLKFLESKGIPFLPLVNRGVVWGAPEVTTSRDAGCDTITFALKSNWLYDSPRVILRLKDDYVEFFFSAARVKRRVALNKWYLFEKGTKINGLECLDFRSHIINSDPYETHQIILGRRKLGISGFQADTEDGDFMFGPHPMLFIFRHLEDNLLVAPLQLVQAESLYVQMDEGSTRLRDFHIRIGDNLYWLQEGEALESPHFMIQLTRDKDPYETLAAYTGILVRDGLVRAKTENEIEPWWLSPMWCSWGDQHFELEKKDSATSLATNRWPLLDRIHDRLVNAVVEVIEKHQLPIRTLILDDMWYDKKGDMHPDKAKFPDMRSTVDRLHGKGFKVLAWSTLYKFDENSQVYKNHPEWFVIHHYPRSWSILDTVPDNIHIDYSDEKIVRAYLGELLHRFLSSDPGCYNFDGIKFDWPFLVPHDYPYENRDWVGKEMTVYKTQKLIYDMAKSFKRDALIIGVSPHPFFNDTQDIIRTYDVATPDIRVHINRAKYVKAIAPGMIPGLDEHVYFQNFFRYLDVGGRLGIPMLYNLLCFNGDNYQPTDADYQTMKKLLWDYVNRTPMLRDYMRSPRR
ncbi:MAG: TIM-barrel domain-containing protein [Phycisphaerae bacterium]|nr:TIM-barrel domain-containing protein [Phycisphaerae bacterium]